MYMYVHAHHILRLQLSVRLSVTGGQRETIDPDTQAAVSLPMER